MEPAPSQLDEEAIGCGLVDIPSDPDKVGLCPHDPHGVPTHAELSSQRRRSRLIGQRANLNVVPATSGAHHDLGDCGDASNG